MLLVATRPKTLSAYQDALRRLSRRDHSEHELRTALRRRGHPEEETDRAVDRLRRSGYLDDRGFAQRFAQFRLRHRRLGRARIRAALRARGVEPGHLEEGLAAALEEVPEGRVLEELAQRYWERHRRDPPRTRLCRLWAFLIRRGFPSHLGAPRLGALWPDRGDELAELALSGEGDQP
jgi:regulatory protein